MGADKYAVETLFLHFTDNIKVYKNNVQVAVGTEKLEYPIAGTTAKIDVAMSDYGLKRMHLVDGAVDRLLRPDLKSAEGMRHQFGKKFPRLSKWLGWLAIAVLLVSVLLWIPQILELVSGWDIFVDRFGRFESPVQLSASVNTTLVVLSILAATERALTVKYHWLIDMDTTSMEE